MTNTPTISSFRYRLNEAFAAICPRAQAIVAFDECCEAIDCSDSSLNRKRYARLDSDRPGTRFKKNELKTICAIINKYRDEHLQLTPEDLVHPTLLKKVLV